MVSMMMQDDMPGQAGLRGRKPQTKCFNATAIIDDMAALNGLSWPLLSGTAQHCAWIGGRGGGGGGATHFSLVLVNGGQEVLCGVIEALSYAAVPLGVGRPQHDDLVHLAGLLEVPDLLPDGLHLLLLAALHHIVRPLALVGCDEVLIVHACKPASLLQVLPQKCCNTPASIIHGEQYCLLTVFISNHWGV